MVLVSTFTVLALVVSSEASVGLSTNTSFCTESKECVEYELVCKTDEYEVSERQQTDAGHVSTQSGFPTRVFGLRCDTTAPPAGCQRMQRPTSWEWVQPWPSGDFSSTSAEPMKEVRRSGGVQMEMTAPVLVKIPEETTMWEPAIYTLSFPLPAAHQDRPPAPTTDKLYFTEMPAVDMYVRSYGGWMLSVTSRLHAHLLTKELDRVRASYNHSYHYAVGYDSPLKLLNRHNEVWYVAEGEPVCTDPQEPTPPRNPGHLPTNSPSEPPPHAPSHSPPLTPGNLSSPTGDSSSHAPSDAPALPTSNAAPATSPQAPASAAFGPPTASAVPLDPAPNSSRPGASASPGPRSDAAPWNSTTHSDSDPAVEPGHAR